MRCESPALEIETGHGEDIKDITLPIFPGNRADLVVRLIVGNCIPKLFENHKQAASSSSRSYAIFVSFCARRMSCFHQCFTMSRPTWALGHADGTPHKNPRKKYDASHILLADST